MYMFYEGTKLVLLNLNGVQQCMASVILKGIQHACKVFEFFGEATRPGHGIHMKADHAQGQLLPTTVLAGSV